MDCEYRGHPSSVEWCSKVCKLLKEKRELELEVKDLKEQIEMWKDNYCSLVESRNRLVAERDGTL